VAVAVAGERLFGYDTLITFSKYPSFSDKGTPEVNDLNVVARARRQGIATLIIAFLEEHTLALGHQEIGIGVGLYADYGSAQRRYIKPGYIPMG
jgi:GNAT superfamily N-acetyltransferase